MRHGSLFSGIGGFDLAAEWMGWENVFHCELNEFCNKVLGYYWPNAINYHDIKQTDFSIHKGRIDILTGGFPCQPYSTAGRRLGKEDQRHLWPYMLRAIREIEPTYVVGENVRGLTNWNGGVVFEEVCSDLEGCGYEVQPILLPACSVDAPHRRDRVWFVAYSNNKRGASGFGQVQKEDGEISKRNNDAELGNSGNESFKDSERHGCLFGKPIKEGAENGEFGHVSSGGINGVCVSTRYVANSSGERCDDGSNNRGERYIQGDKWSSEEGKSKREGRKCGIGEVSEDDANSCRVGLQGSISTGVNDGQEQYVRQKREAVQHLYKNGARVQFKNFPTQSPICGGDDGLPSELDGITFSKWRAESIKGYGNAIVPQVALQIFKTIEKMT